MILNFKNGKNKNKMNKEKCINEIKMNFRDDLDKNLNPLYDIEQSVHEKTIDDLEELFGAVANFAFEKGVKSCEKEIKKLNKLTTKYARQIELMSDGMSYDDTLKGVNE